MSFTEKIDVLDLIIQILQDVEAKLDNLVERLESTVLVIEDRTNRQDLDKLEEMVKRLLGKPEGGEC